MRETARETTMQVKQLSPITALATMPAANLKAAEVNRFAGQKLQELRLMQGISQATLGREISVTGQQVQKYERGANRLTIDKLFMLAEIFDVPIAVFFPSKVAAPPSEILPSASIRLIKIINKISEEHHESLYAILQALLKIIKNDEWGNHECA